MAEEIQIPVFNWKALDSALKTLIEAINGNRPVEGAGIRLVSHGIQGVEIVRADMAHGPDDQKKDTQPSDPFAGTKWMTVTIVDPGDCSQSQIQVLTRPVQ